MSITNNPRSIPELFTDVIGQVTMLLRKEAQLARTEISENVSKVASGIGFIAVGAILLIPALTVLLQAAVVALSDHGLAGYWSALIVGGVFLILGLLLAALGANRLKVGQMIPNKTIHQLQQDASVAREQTRVRHDVHTAA
jgi:hypothetical protein